MWTEHKMNIDIQAARMRRVSLGLVYRLIVAVTTTRSPPLHQALMDRVAPWLDKVTAVAHIARETADWSDAHSRPAAAFVEALRDAGLFSLLVPEQMGGAGLTVWELPPVIEALARV